MPTDNEYQKTTSHMQIDHWHKTRIFLWCTSPGVSLVDHWNFLLFHEMPSVQLPSLHQEQATHTEWAYMVWCNQRHGWKSKIHMGKANYLTIFQWHFDNFIMQEHLLTLNIIKSIANGISYIHMRSLQCTFPSSPGTNNILLCENITGWSHILVYQKMTQCLIQINATTNYTYYNIITIG